MLGEIQLFACCPPGWIPCAGQWMPRVQNERLYLFLENLSGGKSPQRDFIILPDLRNALPEYLKDTGLHYFINIDDQEVNSVGETVLFPYKYSCAVSALSVVGWLPCDGRELNKVEYPALFSKIGNAFDGSGNTLKIPDLRDTAPCSDVHYHICIQ